MSPRRRCQPCGGVKYSRQAANLPGDEIFAAQLPSPAWLGIVECNCQVAKLARRRGSLGAIAKPCVVGNCRMQLPSPVGSGIAKCNRQAANLPGGEIFSAQLLIPAGSGIVKCNPRRCNPRRQTCQVKKFPYLPRWQPAVACVHAFPCLQGCFLVLRAVSSLRQSADSAKILGRSASVSVKAAFCRGKTGCMAGFLVRQLGARRVARANFQKYTQIT